MPTSPVTYILLRAKHAGFFIAALTTLLAIESRSAELIPPNLDRYFNSYAGVVSKKVAYPFNQELAQFEPLTSNRLKDRIDSSRDSAFVGAILKVRLDDRGPGETVPQQHRAGAACELNDAQQRHKQAPVLHHFVLSHFCDCPDCYFENPATWGIRRVARILREEWQEIPELLSTSYSDQAQKWRRRTAAAVGRLASIAGRHRETVGAIATIAPS